MTDNRPPTEPPDKPEDHGYLEIKLYRRFHSRGPRQRKRWLVYLALIGAAASVVGAILAVLQYL